MAHSVHRPGYIRLADGRALSYFDCGPREGPVVVHLHGVPSARVEAVNEAAFCEGAGIRLIAPDRPGCGASDFHEGRTILGWPDDLAQLLDRLGIDRFGLVGVSGGAPYALACARAMPERITGLALVSPVGPIHEEVGLDGVAPMHRTFFYLAPRHPRVARLLGGALLGLMTGSPAVAPRLSRPSFCPADLEYLDVAPPEVLPVGLMTESTRLGLDGVALDFTLLGSAWGFSPEDIEMEVRLWHGDDDRLIPLTHAEALAARLPRAELTVCAGQGHMMLAAQFPEIARTMDWATRPFRPVGLLP